MSFDWQNYLYLAKGLSGNPVSGTENQEAKFRSAISRAYYAAFHVAKDYACNNSQPPDQNAENIHKEIREWFHSNPHRLAKQIGDDLNRLRINRNKADYDGNMGSLSIVKSITQDAVKRAEYIVTNISSLQRRK